MPHNVTEHPYDLILDYGDAARELGLMFYRPPRTAAGPSKRTDGISSNTSTFGISRADEEASNVDQPLERRNWANGAGYSTRLLDDAYALGDNIDTLAEDRIMPGGAITEVSLTDVSWTRRQIMAIIPYVYPGATFPDLYLIPNIEYLLKMPGGTNPIVVAHSSTGMFGESACVYRRPNQVNADLYFAGKDIGGGANRGLARLSGVTGNFEFAGASILRRHLAPTPVYWEVQSGLDTTVGDGVIGGERLLATTDDNTGLYFTAGDPFTIGAWSGAGTTPYRIASTQDPVRSIAASARMAWFATTDGVKTIDDRLHVANILPTWRTVYGLDNGMASIYYEGHLLVSHHLGPVLIPVSAQQPLIHQMQFCGVGMATNSEDEIGNQYTAYCLYRQWVIAAVYNETTHVSRIFFGRLRTAEDPPGRGPMIWHGSYATFQGERITAITAMTPGQQNAGIGPRLYVATVTYNDLFDPHFYWVSLPRSANAYDDWVSGGTHRFNTSGVTVQLGAEHWGRRSVLKILSQIPVASENLNGSERYVTVSARASRSGAWSPQGTVTTDNVTLYPTEDVVEAYELETKLDFVGTDTEPAIIRAVTPSGYLVPLERERVKYEFLLSEGQPLRNGTRETRSVRSRRRMLAALQRRSEIDCIDQRGAHIKVRLERPVEFRAAEDDETGEVVVATCVLMVMRDIAEYGTDGYNEGVLYS